ncbi:unnamed protein product [Aphis gossypii]|uniref:Uncharacterized protein n=1 Tax=Aphis gossypii TaxID=80765 RepID=A0A9P0JD34_APHGO|nr:unnamed protein product [Aphis gossypii]
MTTDAVWNQKKLKPGLRLLVCTYATKSGIRIDVQLNTCTMD